ncbi:MAG TPA: VOC family protein [Candidatus Baltobacteraceae bacterium]|jgi:predicted enzyme related to lactoylglutathione lyase|nr:VOC family protein [Candidatus Baltobacteraceae bacterium]
MITEIAFVGAPVTDIKRARQFYEETLGLKTTSETAGGNWIEYDIGAATFAIGAYPNWKPSADGTLVAFEVDDLDAEMARLKSRDVTIVMDTFDTPVCRCAMIADPDGNKIMIHKRRV